MRPHLRDGALRVRARQVEIDVAVELSEADLTGHLRAFGPEQPSHEMRGTGTIESRMSGSVRWRLEEEGAQTRVHLSAGVENASPFDQGLLALGGRAWLERRFLDVLHCLAERFSEGEGEAARPVSPSCAVTTARGGRWASRGGGRSGPDRTDDPSRA